ncbi:type I-E CRISPR-associated protein Cas5/CasD [Pseudodesulfovibrio indicus]|uniref:type I-E CRISPR-associated protein Cas5/CasD n=1 Tax=Pseudodesulfovibrio indicus TaxID=1716143 RepID=UPI00292E6915|nr:type I-E CRISPR-associated protein Cas5/CasD [Pseudodesulfovibrio indicus]
MSEYLIFTLSGPMQAWGTVAVGEVRPVASRPTRSGVLGLLAASLGLRREEPELLATLDAACRVAVRVDAPGSRLIDYHTVQAPQEKRKRIFRTRRDELVAMLDLDERPNTLLSRREYLVDASFTACVWMETAAPWTPADLAEALREPLFVPFLGRKCCPVSRPFAPQVIAAGDVLEAFAAYAPQSGREGGPVWSDSGHGLGPDIDNHAVRDAVVDHGRRLFGLRREYELPVGRAGEE